MIREVISGDIEPGDFIIISSSYGHDFGFYRGTGLDTIQFYSIRYLALKLNQPELKWPVDYQGGRYKKYRVAKYDPQLITEPGLKEKVEKSIEHIRQSGILPIKY